MTPLSPALRRMRRLADATLGRVTPRVEAALASLLRAVTEEELARILAHRDALALHDLTAALPVRLRPAVRALQEAFNAGAVAGAATVGINVSFVAVDPDAVAYARRYAAGFVTGVAEETRAAIRAVMTRAFVDGLPPREAAKRIRMIVGLTERQALEVYAHIERAIDDGLSRTEAVREGKLLAGAKRHQRAVTIARTETIRASAQGQQAAWRAATNKGLLRPGARKVWIVTPDDWLCARCRPLDGQAVGLDESFLTQKGFVSGPPLHPNCRCALGMQAAPLRKVA